MPDRLLTMTSCDAQTIINEHGDYFLQVNSEAALFAATCNFIHWSNAADGSMQAPIQDIIQHIIICTRLFPPSEETMDISMLNFNLTNDKWTSIIDNLTDAGAFRSQAKDPLHLKTSILNASSNISDNTRQILPHDINRADPFDLPGAPGPDELKFLALVPVTALVVEEGPSMQLICELAGMLGSGTNAARRTEADSDVRIMAAILLPALHKFLGFTNTTCSSQVLATQLKPLLTAAALDGVLRTGDTSTTTLRNDWVDAFRQALSAFTARLSHWLSPTQPGME